MKHVIADTRVAWAWLPQRDWWLRLLGWALLASCTAAAVYLVRGGRDLFLFGASLGGAAATVPVLIVASRRWKIFAMPGGRSIHVHPTPPLGGIAVFLPVLVFLLPAGVRGNAASAGLAVAGLWMLAAGIYDDLRGLAPRQKLLCQVTAGFVLSAWGFRADALALPPFGTLNAGILALPLLVLWVVAVTNALNTIDGLDGLAAGLAVLACVGALLLGLGETVPVILGGALLGFLLWNLPRASIFLGDSGSLVVGLFLAVLLIRSRPAGGGAGLHAPTAAALLALPLGDLALSVVRRSLRGRSPFRGDQGHVHHLLLRQWHRPGRVLAGLLIFAALCVSGGVLLRDRALLCVVLCWAVLLGYLVVVSWPRVRTLLVHRRCFRRLHLTRRYSETALALAERPEEVALILQRVAEDLQISAPTSEDEVYEEERRAIAHEIGRFGRQRLAALGAGTSAAAFPARAADWNHVIISDSGAIGRLAPAVEARRARGPADPEFVQVRGYGQFEWIPTEVLSLGVDHYEALLERHRPVATVIAGGSRATVDCAAEAERRGATVVRLGGVSHAVPAPYASIEAISRIVRGTPYTALPALEMFGAAGQGGVENR